MNLDFVVHLKQVELKVDCIVYFQEVGMQLIEVLPPTIYMRCDFIFRLADALYGAITYAIIGGIYNINGFL